jgi:hypothetical protein
MQTLLLFSALFLFALYFKLLVRVKVEIFSLWSRKDEKDGGNVGFKLVG